MSEKDLNEMKESLKRRQNLQFLSFGLAISGISGYTAKLIESDQSRSDDNETSNDYHGDEVEQ